MNILSIFFSKIYKTFRVANVVYLISISPISGFILAAPLNVWGAAIAALVALFNIGDLAFCFRTADVVDKMKIENDKMHSENIKFASSNDDLQKQILGLNTEIEKFSTANKKLEKENIKFASSNDDLRKQIDKIHANLKELSNSNKLLKDENEKFEKNNHSLLLEVSELKKNNDKLRETTQMQVELNVQAKKFIAALISTSTDLNFIKDELLNGISKVEKISGVMERITAKITVDTFNEIDIDGNGVITLEELTVWSNRHNT